MNRTTEYQITDTCECGWTRTTAKHHDETAAFREANQARQAHLTGEHAA